MNTEDKMFDFVQELNGIPEVVSEMKKLGENYISAKHIETRILADLMYRFAAKIESEYHKTLDNTGKMCYNKVIRKNKHKEK